MSDPRHPAWRQVGDEPDYRFTLANERTFLAWIRTALAVLAAGVLLDQFATKLHPRALVLAVSIGLCVLSAMLCEMAYRHWRHNEVAMRMKGPLPHSRGLVALAGAIVLACAGCAVMVVATIA